jgi:hypothetical protein
MEILTDVGVPVDKYSDVQGMCRVSLMQVYGYNVQSPVIPCSRFFLEKLTVV